MVCRCARTVCTFAGRVGVRAGERKCGGRFVIEERTCTARRTGQSVLKLLMVIFLPTLWSFMFLCAFLRGAWQGWRSACICRHVEVRWCCSHLRAVSFCWLLQRGKCCAGCAEFCLVVPRGESWLSPTSGLIAPGTSRRSEDLVWDRLVRARHAGSSGSCAPGFTSPIFRFGMIFRRPP